MKRGSSTSFRERYRSLLVYKSVDVEEPIDMALHRPLAAALTTLILTIGLPVRPNHITYMSLAAGWAGSACLWFTAFEPLVGPMGYALAGLFLLLSVILDCADGQLARARGGGTRMGRILDGMVDLLVLAPAYGLIVFDIGARYGAVWFAVGAVAGLTMALQIWSYDRIKSLYLSYTQPSSADGVETRAEVEADYARARAEGGIFEVMGLFIYLKILMNLQDMMASGDTEEHAEIVRDAAQRQAFRERHGAAMRLASYLGLGTHMLFVYGAVALAAVWHPALLVLQVVFATVFNGLFAVALARSRSFSAD